MGKCEACKKETDYVVEVDGEKLYMCSFCQVVYD